MRIDENEALAYALAYAAPLLEYERPTLWKCNDYVFEITRFRELNTDGQKSDGLRIIDIHKLYDEDDVCSLNGYVLDIMEYEGLDNAGE